jgi:hypothetical protein
MLEKQPQSQDTIIGVETQSETYKQVSSKLGFYPAEFLKIYPNVKLFCMNVADAELIQEMYTKVLANETISNNMIHIHFDKLKGQASLFYEGVLSDKLSGFHFGMNLLIN